MKLVLSEQDIEESMRKPISSMDTPVLAEFSCTAGQLHKIATGHPLLLTLPGECLGVRFLLEKSFKVPSNNYVVNTFKVQVVALGKENAMQPMQMAVRTKVVKGEPKKEEKPKELTDFSLEESNKVVF